MEEKQILLTLALVGSLLGCGQPRPNFLTGKASTDTAWSGASGFARAEIQLSEPPRNDKPAPPPPPGSFSSPFLSSSAAVENGRDTARKFIRTAGLKFRTANVFQSSVNIRVYVD